MSSESFDRQQDGGAKDPDRYYYTRLFAGFSLSVLIVMTGYIMVVITICPDVSIAIERVSGIIIMLIVTLGGIVAHYMGISNAWGMKK